MKKVIVSGMVGNTLEWYDYALYGHVATIIGALYFPGDNEYVKMISVFGVFAAGFLMRPVGALIFGRLGDKFGRKVALTSSIILMAIATGCLVILPTYAQIGIAAPILLTVIRLVQGISLGGEFSGSMLFVAESAPKKYRTVVASSCLFSACIGILLGSFVSTLFSQLLPEGAFQSWGWRLPFILGVLLGLVGMYIRHSVPESPEYTTAKEKGLLSTMPVKDTFSKHRTILLMGVCLYLTVTVPFYTLTVFINSFFVNIAEHTEPREIILSNALFMNTIAMLVMTFMIPASAYISDKVGRKRLMLASAWGVMLVAYPCFLLLTQGGTLLPLIGWVGFAAVLGVFLGPVPAVLVDLFPIEVRYTGMSLAYNFTAAFFGGTTPMVATWLIKNTGDKTAPAFYVMACVLVTLFTMRWFNAEMRKAKR